MGKEKLSFYRNDYFIEKKIEGLVAFFLWKTPIMTPTLKVNKNGDYKVWKL